MVKVLKQKEFSVLLEAVRKRDVDLRALILGSVQDLIPADVNALELRGPSWTKAAEADAPVRGAFVAIFSPDLGRDVATGTTLPEGRFFANLLPDDYAARAQFGGRTGIQEVSVGSAPWSVVVTLGTAPPPPRPPPRRGQPASGGTSPS